MVTIKAAFNSAPKNQLKTLTHWQVLLPVGSSSGKGQHCIFRWLQNTQAGPIRFRLVRNTGTGRFERLHPKRGLRGGLRVNSRALLLSRVDDDASAGAAIEDTEQDGHDDCGKSELDAVECSSFNFSDNAACN